MEYRESEVDEDLAFKYYQKKMGYTNEQMLQGNFYHLTQKGSNHCVLINHLTF